MKAKNFFIIFLHIMTRLYRVFLLKLAPPKFSKYKFPLYPLSLREISAPRKFRGGPVKKNHPVPIGSDEIMKRHKIWLNNPQQGHKEGQKFPFFW